VGSRVSDPGDGLDRTGASGRPAQVKIYSDGGENDQRGNGYVEEFLHRTQQLN
jgi:hypothetical protein